MNQQPPKECPACRSTDIEIVSTNARAGAYRPNKEWEYLIDECKSIIDAHLKKHYSQLRLPIAAPA